MSSRKTPSRTGYYILSPIMSSSSSSSSSNTTTTTTTTSPIPTTDAPSSSSSSSSLPSPSLPLPPLPLPLPIKRNNSCWEIDPHGQRPGCNDSDCLAKVCSVLIECCSMSYTRSCVDLAIQICNDDDDDASNTTTIISSSPTNHCFQPSSSSNTLPGCSDEICLQDAVCPIEPSCCTDFYGPQCIEIARRYHNTSCPIPSSSSSINECTKENLFLGGCQDKRCSRAVCDIERSCCNDVPNNFIGRWHQGCVDIAKEVCQPPVYERYVVVPSPFPFCCLLTSISFFQKRKKTRRRKIQKRPFSREIQSVCGQILPVDTLTNLWLYQSRATDTLFTSHGREGGYTCFFFFFFFVGVFLLFLLLLLIIIIPHDHSFLLTCTYTCTHTCTHAQTTGTMSNRIYMFRNGNGELYRYCNPSAGRITYRGYLCRYILRKKY